jgi:hypothetical protein
MELPRAAGIVGRSTLEHVPELPDFREPCLCHRHHEAPGRTERRRLGSVGQHDQVDDGRGGGVGCVIGRRDITGIAK